MHLESRGGVAERVVELVARLAAEGEHDEIGRDRQPTTRVDVLYGDVSSGIGDGAR